MKNLLITTVLVLFCTVIFAQEQTVPTPDFVDQPMLWDKTTNTLSKISKESYEMKGKIGKMLYIFDGPQSETRVAKETDFSFLISTSNSTAITAAKLYVLETKKKRREVEAMQVKGYMSASIEQNSDVEIGFDLRKVNDDVYELVLNKKPGPGEYAFVVGMNGFTFGID